MLELFDPKRYPGFTEDAYRRLEQVNAAYAQIRGGVTQEAAEPEASAEPDGSTDDSDADGRVAEVADNLVRIGFISRDARKPRNPAVEVLATLLPAGSQIAVCRTCLGVKSKAHYECRERSGSFSATTVTRQDWPYAVGDSVHPITRTEIVLCTDDELSWTVSKYEGHRTDRVTLYSIPFTDILGAEVRNRKRDVVDVWIAGGPTISIQTKPREADALRASIERAATSE